MTTVTAGSAQHELQEQLRPRFGTGLRRPCRHRLVADLPEQAAILEGAIDDHGDAQVARQRHSRRLGVARHHRVIDLHEVRLAGLHRVHEGVVRIVAIVGEAGVPDLALRLQFAGDRDLGAPVAQVVDLQQVDPVGAQPAQRILELRETGIAAFGWPAWSQEMSARAPCARPAGRRAHPRRNRSSARCRSLPPAARNSPSTSRSGSRSPALSPTSKLPEVPMPITGSCSLLEGIARVCNPPVTGLAEVSAGAAAGTAGSLHATSGVSANTPVASAAPASVVLLRNWRRVVMAATPGGDGRSSPRIR